MKEVLACERPDPATVGLERTGALPRAECKVLAPATLTALHGDSRFDAFSVQQQLSPATDDGARRLALCSNELRLLGDRADGRVLDLMCGVGSYVEAFRLAGRTWTSYLGIDISPRAITVARQRHSSTGAQFRAADVLRLGTPAPHWDTLLLTYEAINNLGCADADALLRWAATGMAPGSRALIDLNLECGQVSGHAITTVADATSAPVAGVCAVATTATVVASTPDESVVRYEVHWLDESNCLYHVGYQQWYPAAHLAARLFEECGYHVLDSVQAHADASDKPSVTTARQFVLGPR